MHCNYRGQLEPGKGDLAWGNKLWSVYRLCYENMFWYEYLFSRKFISSSWNSWPGPTSKIPLAIRKNVWLARRAFSSIIRKSEELFVSKSGESKRGASVTILVATTSWRVFSGGAAPYSWSGNGTTLRAFDKSVSKLACCECCATSLGSPKNISWTYLSMNDVPRRISTTRFATNLNHKLMRRFSTWRCNKISFSSLVACSFCEHKI